MRWRNHERQLYSQALESRPLNISEPREHFELLHGVRTGTVVLWNRHADKGSWLKISPDKSPDHVLNQVINGIDIYMSVSQFYGWRLLKNLKTLHCCFVDIDKNQDLDGVLDCLRSHLMPEPTFVVFSGRGIHLYWTLLPTPGNRLPLWQQIQDKLINCLLPLGADPKAKDATRVLRMLGTFNSKNKAFRTVGAQIGTGGWSLDQLADEVIGTRMTNVEKRAKAKACAAAVSIQATSKVIPKAKVYDLSATAARRGKSVRKHSGSIYQWWWHVYVDLQKIVDYRWPRGIPEGERNQILFVMGVALSWFTQGESLENELLETARRFSPSFSDDEVRSTMNTVLTRAAEAAEGKLREYNGGKYDPRYRFKSETIRDWIGDIPAELHSQLRALAPPAVIKARRKDRDAARDRVKEGRYQQTRQEYLEGPQATAAAIWRLYGEGKTKAEIAQLVGVAVRTVNRALTKDLGTGAPALYGGPAVPPGGFSRQGNGF